MNLDVLISTMELYTEEENNNLLKQMNINSNSITISQVKNNIEINEKNSTNKLFVYKEKGLSKSRNMAIKKSVADICVIADDDIIYVDNYEQIIKQAYEENNDADIIIFKIDDKNDDRKNSNIKVNKIDFINTMRVCSNQITFKRERILKNNIYFDELFGSGSKYCFGEDTIILCDALKQKMKIVYVDKLICIKPKNKSSWFKGYNKDYFLSRGAVFYRMSCRLYIFLILQFAIRKRNKYIKNISMFQSIHYMIKGANEYKKFIRRCF